MKITDAGINDILIPKKDGLSLVKKITLFFIIGVVLMWLVYYFFNKSDIVISSSNIETSVVKRENLKNEIPLEGIVVAYESRDSYTQNKGIITIYVNEGENVKKDQLLAKIRNKEVESKLSENRVSFQILETKLKSLKLNTELRHIENNEAAELAKTKLKIDKRELQRARKAHDLGVISTSKFSKTMDTFEFSKAKRESILKINKIKQTAMESELEILNLEVNKQRMLVNQLEEQVDSLNINSIVDGTVGSLFVEQETFVNVDAKVIRVVDLSKLEIEISIPESYSGSIKLGMITTIKNGEEKWGGKIVSISPEVKDNRVLGRVRFNDEIPNNLRQNKRLIVDIVLESKTNILTVPVGKYIKPMKENLVYILKDGYAELKRINTGISTYSKVEILKGLEEGDILITSDTTKFKEKKRVTITK